MLSMSIHIDMLRQSTLSEYTHQRVPTPLVCTQQKLKYKILLRFKIDAPPLWKIAWRLLRKLNELPYDPAIPLLSMYPDKIMTQKNTHTPMFTAALFTIAKTWKKSKCASTDEWIKKMWYIHTREYYSDLKSNEIMPFAALWMELKNIILNEVSQKEKDKYHLISLICGI